MLSGTLPFQAESAVIVAMMQLQNEPKPLREIDPTIPLGLTQITMNAMQKEVVRRYQTAAEMLCDLETFRRDPTATFEHHYFVDEAPTRFVNDQAPATEQAKEEPKKNNKNSWVPIVTGIAVGVAVLVVIILAIVVFKNMNSSTKPIKCPTFVGKTVDEIRKEYDPDDFTFEIVYEETSDYKVGEVIKQSPTPGTEIKKKNAIKLTIAKSAALIVVPDVSNDTEALAKMTLKQAGFINIEIEQAYDDTVKEGKVIKTEPLAGSQISGEKTLTLYISKGVEVHYTTVPSVLGYDEKSAKDMLESKKLKLGSVSESNSSQPKGYVTYQSISEGQQVEEGTTVNITISAGPGSSSSSVTVTVNLPTDCAFDNGYVVAQLSSGEEQKSPLLSFVNDSSYSFTINSNESTETILIKLMNADDKSEYDYQKIRVNVSKNTQSVVSSYNDYPKTGE